MDMENSYRLAESAFSPGKARSQETLFTLGNGYIGLRGTFEESLPDPALTTEGTYINAFYESERILYGESAFGFPQRGQTLLNVLNGKVLKTRVDGVEINLLDCPPVSYSRTLDMRRGLLTRRFTVRLPSGKELSFQIERLVSFERRHLAAVRYQVTPLNFSGEIELYSAIDGDVSNMVAEDDPRVGAGFAGRVLSPVERAAEGESLYLSSRTQHTGFTVCCAAEHRLEGSGCEFTAEAGESLVSLCYHVTAKQGEPVALTKFLGYADDKFCPYEEAAGTARAATRSGLTDGFDALLREQEHFLSRFWERTDVTIRGNDELNRAMKLNLFHLLQSVGRDGHTNIAAKGLSGEGYEGHYFWDTETYILPVFVYTNPEIAKKLLEYRYSILDRARARAREMAHPTGALFPWRTIDGDECSAYFPAGTAQYHINADIAFALKRYCEATGDREFLYEKGAEILAETARLWNDLGAYIDGKGFCINCVTGPDEYTALVNNNYYTNLMARENLLYAADTLEEMKRSSPAEYARLAEKTGLSEKEPADWRQAGERMYLPYDESRGICLQDDSFLEKEPWDFAGTPKENYPLLMHYHPLVIYRRQVCKQADTVLAEFLLSSRFDKAQKKRDYDFYEPLTTHDSSLSAAIFSIIACEIGYTDDAFKHFSHTALTDLCDLHKNTRDGIHAASMAGAWMCVVNGFAGLRTDSGMLRFQTMLPKELDGYSFRLQYHGTLLEVNVTGDKSELKRLDGPEITVEFNGKQQTL